MSKRLWFTVISLAAAVTYGCGGGGGGTPTTTGGSATSPITAGPTLANYGSIDLIGPSGLAKNNPQGDSLFFDVLAVGDANMDGHDDILLGLMRNDARTGKSVPRTVKPVLLLFDPKLNQFVASEEFAAVVSAHIWPRQGSIQDFDGDGRNDIFIGDTGIDGLDNNCGYQNSLILNKRTGMVNASNTLPQGWDYSHGLVVTDFDKDGVKDLLVLNSPYLINQWNKLNTTTCEGFNGQTIRNRSYAFSAVRTAELSLLLTADDLDADGNPPLNLTDKYSREQHVGAAADLNGDGFPDLVLGGSNIITILESDGKQSFKKSQRSPPPPGLLSLIDSNSCSKKWGKCNTPYSFVLTTDLDGDGQAEIIASLAYNNFGSWQGQYFQVLKKVNGEWRDVSDKFFPTQNGVRGSATWCYRVELVDLNLDGTLDLVCNNLDSQNSKVFWLYQDGAFKPWGSPPEQSGKRYTVLTVGGRRHVLGISGISSAQIVGWKY